MSATHTKAPAPRDRFLSYGRCAFGESVLTGHKERTSWNLQRWHATQISMDPFLYLNMAMTPSIVNICPEPGNDECHDIRRKFPKMDVLGKVTYQYYLRKELRRPSQTCKLRYLEMESRSAIYQHRRTHAYTFWNDASPDGIARPHWVVWLRQQLHCILGPFEIFRFLQPHGSNSAECIMR